MVTKEPTAPRSPGNHHPLSACKGLAALHHSYQWNKAARGLARPCLSLCAQGPSTRQRVSAPLSFSWLRTIPLCDQTAFGRFLPVWMSTWVGSGRRSRGPKFTRLRRCVSFRRASSQRRDRCGPSQPCVSPRRRHAVPLWLSATREAWKATALALVLARRPREASCFSFIPGTLGPHLGPTWHAAQSADSAGTDDHHDERMKVVLL